MKAGKLNWDDLKTIIDENKSVKREEVRVRSGIGEDCCVVNYGDYECVLSTDPITGSDSMIGKLAVHINCNDIASCGVEPLGIMVTILLPVTATLDDVKRIMKEMDEETKKLNVEILGGHTEVTEAVNKIVVSCTVIGKAKKNKAVATSGAKVDDDIIVTKKIGMEGTAIVLNDYYDKVKEFLTEEEINFGKSFIDSISVVKEGKVAGEFGVNSMHDITEGGLLGALWEVAEASELGFKIYEDKVPMSEITKKICSRFEIDPLRFISSGSMLITCKNGEKLIDKLKENHIGCSLIGKIVDKGGIVIKANESVEVTPPERDELFKLYEKIK